MLRYFYAGATGFILTMWYVNISYYINCQHRNNLKRAKGGANEFKIKVSRLSSKLGVDEKRIKSKGYSSTLKKPLEKILNDIRPIIIALFKLR